MRACFEVAEWTACTNEDLHSLSNLLIKVVADGASVGFLPPLSTTKALEYWASVLHPDVKVWLVRKGKDILGTIQLHLAQKENGRHRAEIAKLMVDPDARRKGIAKKLMEVAEQKAIQENRTLLVLDTREGDPSNLLYQSLGYKEAGMIPCYAKSATGTLDATVFYYKLF